MIHLHDLTLSDIGRWVVYRAPYCRPDEGRLKGWTSSVVHVVYKCDGNWDRYWDYTGVPTNPEDLEFVE